MRLLVNPSETNAHWPVSLGLGVGGPGSGVSGWVLGFHHLSLSQAPWGMEDRLE